MDVISISKHCLEAAADASEWLVEVESISESFGHGAMRQEADVEVRVY